MPELSKELAKRIKLVRRDLSGLLFHFTRGCNSISDESTSNKDSAFGNKNLALDVLKAILTEKKLRGSGDWTKDEACVCFTEAPIQEFASIFALVQIAASQKERPRYEPYGIAVTKEWLFRQGGRPVIYEKSSEFDHFKDSQRYRLVDFDPEINIDFTWEREWRIKTDNLILDPKHTLVVVPTANEAFELMSSFAKQETDNTIYSGSTGSADVAMAWGPIPFWMAVSLDLFGIRFDN